MEIDPDLTPAAETERITALFTRGDGAFRFARWGRPLVPVVFGTDDAGAAIFEAALGAVAGLGGLPLSGTDPELGANFLMFFCTAWDELPSLPGLVKLVPGIAKLVSVLKGAGANQYRIFGFDEAGAIRVCIVLLRYDEHLRRVSAQALATSQAVQSLLLWSEHAFTGESPVALVGETGRAVVKPWHADLVRAAYDAALPASGEDAALALRLQARMGLIREARA